MSGVSRPRRRKLGRACTLVALVAVLAAAHVVRPELVERFAVDVAQVKMPLVSGIPFLELFVECNQRREIVRREWPFTGEKRASSGLQFRFYRQIGSRRNRQEAVVLDDFLRCGSLFSSSGATRSRVGRLVGGRVQWNAMSFEALRDTTT